MAPAKLNLRLPVGPRRDDGYHPLSNLMVALDALRTPSGPAAPESAAVPGHRGAANLVWTALDALEAEAAGRSPCGSDRQGDPIARPAWAAGRATPPRSWSAADRLLRLGLGPARLGPWRRGWGPTSRSSCAAAPSGPRAAARPHPGPRAPEFAALLVMPAAGLSTAAVYGPLRRGCRRRSAPPARRAAPGDPRPRGLVAQRPLAGRPGARRAGARAAPAPSRRRRTGAVLLCGSGSCIAGLFPDRASADAVARGWPGVDSGPW